MTGGARGSASDKDRASRAKGDAWSLAYVARSGERLAGIVCCQIVDRDALTQPGVPIARVDLLAVAPRFRRRGVATRLWRRMEAKLKAMGISSAWTRSRVLGAGVDLTDGGTMSGAFEIFAKTLSELDESLKKI